MTYIGCGKISCTVIHSFATNPLFQHHYLSKISLHQKLTLNEASYFIWEMLIVLSEWAGHLFIGWLLANPCIVCSTYPWYCTFAVSGIEFPGPCYGNCIMYSQSHGPVSYSALCLSSLLVIGGKPQLGNAYVPTHRIIYMPQCVIFWENYSHCCIINGLLQLPTLFFSLAILLQTWRWAVRLVLTVTRRVMTMVPLPKPLLRPPRHPTNTASLGEPSTPSWGEILLSSNECS